MIITVDLAGYLNGHNPLLGKHQEIGDALVIDGKCDDGKGKE